MKFTVIIPASNKAFKHDFDVIPIVGDEITYERKEYRVIRRMISIDKSAMHTLILSLI